MHEFDSVPASPSLVAPPPLTSEEMEKLYQDLKQILRRVARRWAGHVFPAHNESITTPTDLAHDTIHNMLTSNTVVEMIRRESSDPVEMLKFALTVLYRVIAEHHRKRASRKRLAEGVPPKSPHAESDPSHRDLELDHAELQLRLAKEDPGAADAFMLSLQDDRSQEQMAAELGMSRGQFQRALKRAKIWYRPML